jgi:hypothetical protein
LGHHAFGAFHPFPLHVISEQAQDGVDVAALERGVGVFDGLCICGTRT